MKIKCLTIAVFYFDSKGNKMQSAVNEKYKVNEVRHKIILTKEHGSWAVLFVPIITGIAVSENVNFSIILFVISLLFLFMSYTPAETILQNFIKKQPVNGKLASAKYWFYIFFLIALCAGILAVATTDRYLLLLFALLAIVLFFFSLLIVIKKRKNVYSDFLAMTGLTLSAPAIVYYLDGGFSPKSIYLWIFNVLFFGSSAAYVHMKIRMSSLKKKELSIEEKLKTGKLNLIYHAVSSAVLLFIIINDTSKILIIAAFLPAFLHAIMGTFILPEKTSFKKIGIIYVGYSIIFALFVILVLR